MSTSCRIMVQGREIPVRTTAPQELVQRIESLVNERLATAEATLSLFDPQLVAVLALLNLAEEVVALRDMVAQGDAAIVCRLTDIVEQIDTCLAVTPH